MRASCKTQMKVPSCGYGIASVPSTGAHTSPLPEAQLKPAHFTIVTGAFPVTIVKCVGQPFPSNTVWHKPKRLSVCGYGLASVPSCGYGIASVPSTGADTATSPVTH